MSAILTSPTWRPVALSTPAAALVALMMSCAVAGAAPATAMPDGLNETLAPGSATESPEAIDDLSRAVASMQNQRAAVR